MVRDEKKYEKTLTLKMSVEEHRQIKSLATDAGLSIKDFLFSLIEKSNPGWRNRERTK